MALRSFASKEQGFSTARKLQLEPARRFHATPNMNIFSYCIRLDFIPAC
jgi:hypothetical protein